MEELIKNYLEANYECVFDSSVNSECFFFRDKTNGEEISLYVLKGIMYRIFSIPTISENCDEFFKFKKEKAIDVLPF